MCQFGGTYLLHRKAKKTSKFFCCGVFVCVENIAKCATILILIVATVAVGSLKCYPCRKERERRSHDCIE